MIELYAVTLHALSTMPRPMTCPRAKVWMRRHDHSMREAAMPEITEAVLNMFNAPFSTIVALLAVLLFIKYTSPFHRK
jgi:hypothetical protein